MLGSSSITASCKVGEQLCMWVMHSDGKESSQHLTPEAQRGGVNLLRNAVAAAVAVAVAVAAALA
eukprot:10806169-Prorocentrum_lima.AAC.1